MSVEAQEEWLREIRVETREKPWSPELYVEMYERVVEFFQANHVHSHPAPHPRPLPQPRTPPTPPPTPPQGGGVRQRPQVNPPRPTVSDEAGDQRDEEY
ncbi:MAG: hypothetical protein ACTSU5_22085, partial [Promethearchaeota archaeon]